MALSPEELKKLADLCRLSVTEEEAAAFASQFAAVLSYVEKVREAAAAAAPPPLDRRNFLRDDVRSHAPEAYTDRLLPLAPKTKDGYVSVQSILP